MEKRMKERDDKTASVVVLRNKGMTFKQIGKFFGRSPDWARFIYQRSKGTYGKY